MFRLEILIFITFTSLAPIESNSCYQCSGMRCEPEIKYLKPCQSQNLEEPRCFFVAWNSNGIHRGCYEPGAPFINECNNNRLTNCIICSGDGCNNQPIFQDVDFSCRKCDFGVCSALDQRFKVNYHKCEKFVTGAIPSCFTLFLFGEYQYKFGCTNEMTRVDLAMCNGDHFNFICRYCETQNCNYEYFYEYKNETRFKLGCKFYKNEEESYGEVCGQYDLRSPMHACYINSMASIYPSGEDSGCLQSNDYDFTSALIKEEGFYLCTQTMCNMKENIDYGNCSLLRAYCVRATYTDENDALIDDAGCQTQIPCNNQADCYVCKQRKCNIDTWEESSFTYRCFDCGRQADCAMIGKYSLNKTEACIGTEGKTECFTYYDPKIPDPDLNTYRGCADDSSDHFPACRSNMANCRICQGNLCNDEDLHLYCHVCDTLNDLCSMEQSGNLLDRCPGRPTFHSKGCYTAVRHDGMVERGCFKGKTYNCPEGFSCETCHTHGCNAKSFRLGQCVQCNGSLSSYCANDHQFISGQMVECPVEYEIPFCYIVLENKTVIRRGCTAHMMFRERMRRLCGAWDYMCYFCNLNKCNRFTLAIADEKSNAAVKSTSIVCLLFSFICGAIGFKIKGNKAY